MDLGTENRLAALLLEEARRLRAEAEKEGVHAYLQKPSVRHRPNSRFLTATVLGVQQANRVVEVNEMWRAREKEMELESKMKTRVNGRTDSTSHKRKNYSRDQSFSYKTEQDRPYAAPCSSRDSHSDREDGLGDDEIEKFLHSRVKRGRGAIGSRMDEPGPYLTAPSGRQDKSTSPDARVEEERKHRVYGPEKPLFLRSKSSDEEPSTSKDKHREKKKKASSNHERMGEEKRRPRHRRHHEHKRRSRD